MKGLNLLCSSHNIQFVHSSSDLQGKEREESGSLSSCPLPLQSIPVSQRDTDKMNVMEKTQKNRKHQSLQTTEGIANKTHPPLFYNSFASSSFPSKGMKGIMNANTWYCK